MWVNLVVQVNSADVASWKALLSAGFRLVGRGELAPDNPIDDRMHEILRIARIASATDRPPHHADRVVAGVDPGSHTLKRNSMTSPSWAT